MRRFHIFVLLTTFAFVPCVLYVTAVVTNSWACFRLLPGSKLRLQDDDNPEYIEISTLGVSSHTHAPSQKHSPTPSSVNDPVLLTYNWSGELCIGLWTFTLQPTFPNETYSGRKEQRTISNCYQSTTSTTRHRVCPILILTRSFVVTAPILSVIFCITILHILSRPRTVLTQRCDALIFAFFPGLTACIGWVIFRMGIVEYLPNAAEFLPLYVDDGLAWKPLTPLGSSQTVFMAGWALQLIVALYFSALHCVRGTRVESEDEGDIGGGGGRGGDRRHLARNRLVLLAGEGGEEGSTTSVAEDGREGDGQGETRREVGLVYEDGEMDHEEEDGAEAPLLRAGHD